MANQLGTIGNSGSLEDCHTNLYELTDIAGIQYKKFIPTNESLVNSLADPILELYTRCVQAGILCCWVNGRREGDSGSLRRELWVFWYDEGGDPLVMRHVGNVVAVKEDDRGNWKNGLTYEIRSILFKALSLYFQRHFLSKGYIRMGLRHQLLYRPDRSNECRYSFSITLFLHGESTICGAIDVRSVPAIRQITESDLCGIVGSRSGVEVVLAPYGVKGRLTGRTVPPEDDARLQEAWLAYFPLLCLQKAGLKRARFVEVLVGAYKMEYPACFVCVEIAQRRKRSINDITAPDAQFYSYVGRKISDRSIKECMRVNETGKRCWQYEAPYLGRRVCDCGNCLTPSSRLSIDDSTQKSPQKPFHHKLKQAENLSCTVTDKSMTHSPPQSTTAISAKDPSMPTLSPQMPQEASQKPPTKSTTAAASNILNELLNHNTGAKSMNSHIKSEADVKYALQQPPFKLHNSGTPPPPSITPTNNNKIEMEVPQISKTPLLASSNPPAATGTLNEFQKNDKRFHDLPMGIEIPNYNKMDISRKAIIPNINVVSKSRYNNHRSKMRQNTSSFQTDFGISEVPLYPSLENRLTDIDKMFNSYYNQKSTNSSAISPQHDRFTEINKQNPQVTKIDYNNTMLTNCWLSFSNGLPLLEESPAAKKLRRHPNTIESNSINNTINGINKNVDIKSEMTINSTTNYSSHNNHAHLQSHPTSASESNKVYTGLQSEKLEYQSNIPDQIFDDSDDDDFNIHHQHHYTYNYTGDSSNNNHSSIKYEPSTVLGNSYEMMNHQQSHNSNYINSRLISPNNNPSKVVRPNNIVYNNLPGTSMRHSSGSGNINSNDLSLMYLTPPSHEGAPCTIGSPIEQRQTLNSDINNSSVASHDIMNQASFLNSLSMFCQNWDEFDKDWCSNSVNMSLFCHGAKYTKLATANNSNKPPQEPHMSFNHYRYLSQKQKKRQQLLHNQQHNSRRSNALTNTNAKQKSPLTSHSPNIPPDVSLLRRNFNLQPPPPLQSIQKSASFVVPAPATQPVINALYFTVLLSDSLLDIYRDHNFDSCNICVCSMSVLGNEVGLYLDDYNQLTTPIPPQQQPLSGFGRSLSSNTDDISAYAGLGRPESCKCGFSAVRNRHYAVHSNLFFEDEMDITGNIVHATSYNKDKHVNNPVTHTNVSKYLPIHLDSVYNEFGLGFVIDCYKYNYVKSKNKDLPENDVEFADFNKAISYALDQCYNSCTTENNKNTIFNIDHDHQWLSPGYYFNKEAPIPKNQNDQIRLLMSLRPNLQEAVNNSRLSMSSYTVDGPLTWKTFHRLAGRKNLESCEPQPIPKILALVAKSTPKETIHHQNIPGLNAMRTSQHVGPPPNIVNQQNASCANNYSTYSVYNGSSNGFIPNQSSNFNANNQQKSTITKKPSILKHFSLDGNPLCLSEGFYDRDKECVSVSPYAVREWEKLNLEPIYKPKEIAYTVVTPADSNKIIAKSLTTYFKELNKSYQGCRLGHHFSYRSDKHQDDTVNSLIEINTKSWEESANNANNPSIPFLNHQAENPVFYKYWLRELTNSLSPNYASNSTSEYSPAAEELMSRILWYADQVRRTTVHNLLMHGVNKRKGKRSGLFPLKRVSNNKAGVNNNAIKQQVDDVSQAIDLLLSPANGCGPQSRTVHSSNWLNADQDVYLVIYIVNPFTFGQDANDASHRLSIKQINCACEYILKDLPDCWRPRITFHLLSLGKLLSTTSGSQANTLNVPGDMDGSHPGYFDPHTASQYTTTSGSVPWWSIRWSKSPRYQSQALALYSSIPRRILRVSGLLQLIQILTGTNLNQTANSSNPPPRLTPLCTSDPRCYMGRLCMRPDAPAASLLNSTRSLTGSGPAGDAEKLTGKFLKTLLMDCINWNVMNYRNVDPAIIDISELYMTIHAPCYVLAPSKTLEYQAASYSASENRIPGQGNGYNNSNINQKSSTTSASNQVTDPEFWGNCGDKSSVLFVAYCLSNDQRFLLVSCTDQRGTLLRQTQINIGLSPTTEAARRPAQGGSSLANLLKKHPKIISPRREGLAKMWDFIIDVISETCQPWRLVIGRLGRSGHGELKGWNGLLGRTNLLRVNQRFRDECKLCNVWSPATSASNGSVSSSNASSGIGRIDLTSIQCPAIISGCFVSLESLSSFRIFPGSVKHEERASSQLQICTPRDIGVTHILVFPTSTSAGAIQNDQDLAGNGMVNLEELLDLNLDINDTMGSVFDPCGMEGLLVQQPPGMHGGAGSGGFGGVNAKLNDDHSNGAQGMSAQSMMSLVSHSNNQSNSGSLNNMGSNNNSGLLRSMGPNNTNNSTQKGIEAQEEGLILMQQPLAMGYYISTAGQGGILPFWLPQQQGPACFKAALHLQTSLISQEDGVGAVTNGTAGAGSSGSGSAAVLSPHPLDSQQTCDVLHFVLDSYNALSWLTIDPDTNARRSCLPIHMCTLAQLYQADSIFL